MGILSFDTAHRWSIGVAPWQSLSGHKFRKSERSMCLLHPSNACSSGCWVFGTSLWLPGQGNICLSTNYEARDNPENCRFFHYQYVESLGGVTSFPDDVAGAVHLPAFFPPSCKLSRSVSCQRHQSMVRDRIIPWAMSFDLILGNFPHF